METVEVNLSICTLKNGMPDGPAFIQYNKHPNDPNERYSFRGLGLFKDGKLHGESPFICISGNGYGLSISSMNMGRPADQSFITQFNKNDNKQMAADSMQPKKNVSGLQCL
jgi:hypothetical protein